MREKKGIHINMLAKIFRRVAWWLLLAAVLAYSTLFALPALLGKNEKLKTSPVVLSVWHVDTFEGGKGSRANFLKKIANRFEKTQTNVTTLVSAMTKTGVETAFAEGRFPDVLSYGVGVSVNAEECVCWCEGRYALYSLTENFQSVSTENTVVSVGGNNFPLAAAFWGGLTGELTAKDATTAYVEFLGGKYAYLLGTQRDASRLETRGVSAYCQPIDGFSDLQQYVSVFGGENKKTANAFVAYLLQEESQKLLTEIGMFSPLYDVYPSDGGLRKTLEAVKPTYTLSPFLGERGRSELQTLLHRGDGEVLKKFWKVRSNTFKL